MRRPLMRLHWRGESPRRSSPSKARRVAVTIPGRGTRPRMARPVVDLPDPDSPTTPSRSRPRSKETGDALAVEPDGRYRLLVDRADLEELVDDGTAESKVIPLIAEEVEVGKRQVESGKVRIRKGVVDPRGNGRRPDSTERWSRSSGWRSTGRSTGRSSCPPRRGRDDRAGGRGSACRREAARS